jgi:hypothetical protein
LHSQLSAAAQVAVHAVPKEAPKKIGDQHSHVAPRVLANAAEQSRSGAARRSTLQGARGEAHSEKKSIEGDVRSH